MLPLCPSEASAIEILASGHCDLLRIILNHLDSISLESFGLDANAQSHSVFKFLTRAGESDGCYATALWLKIKRSPGLRGGGWPIHLHHITPLPRIAVSSSDRLAWPGRSTTSSSSSHSSWSHSLSTSTLSLSSQSGKLESLRVHQVQVQWVLRTILCYDNLEIFIFNIS